MLSDYSPLLFALINPDNDLFKCVILNANLLWVPVPLSLSLNYCDNMCLSHLQSSSPILLSQEMTYIPMIMKTKILLNVTENPRLIQIQSKHYTKIQAIVPKNQVGIHRQ